MTLHHVDDLMTGVLQEPWLLLGIPLALAGAVCMSLGAKYQHTGVSKVESRSAQAAIGGLNLTHLRALLGRPSWLLGTLLLGLAVLCQLAAISMAPLMVVQPLGVVALLVTTLLSARASGVAPTRDSWIAIAACVGGIVVFVILATQFATKRAVTNQDISVILVVLLVVLLALTLLWVTFRTRLPALFYVTAAGVLYGFVATLAKVVIDRLQGGGPDWATLVCIVALLVAAVIGAYFVQSAYSSGPPDLVVAGLTVVDPLVAVLIAMLVLGEAAGVPPWAGFCFAVAGAVAIWGVVGLARHHPDVTRSPNEKLASANKP